MRGPKKPHEPDRKEWAELLEAFSSPAHVQEALREKGDAQEGLSSKGDQLKHYPHPQQTFDLHGLTGAEAERAAERFLRTVANQRLRTVRLITGRGLHSKGGQPVLPEVIENLLTRLRQSRKVLEFKWESGRGAVLVYLV